MPKTIVERQADPIKVAELQQMGIHPMLAKLLAARGVDAHSYSESGLKNLLNPNLMKDIDKASEILRLAIKKGARCLFCIDYDVDGVTSGTIGVRGLRMFYEACGYSKEQARELVQFRVPSRFKHGYGLSVGFVEEAIEAQKPDLIITVDTGIVNHAGVQRAKELGVGTVITDHHLQGDTLPDALAIVNPNRKDCPFPSKAIAGCGVIFYVLLYLRALMRDQDFPRNKEPDLASLMDVLSVGLVCDVVPLDENNRRMIRAGLARVRKGECSAGIKALLEVGGKHIAETTTQDYGFCIGPMLNAAGRLEDATIGANLLLTDDPGYAYALASELKKINQQRKDIEAQMREQAFSEDEILNAIASAGTGKGIASIVHYGENYHHGVVGILASRIKDATYRPTIVMAPDEDGLIRGSGRSIPGIHIRDVVLWVQSQLPEGAIPKAGGHQAAMGCSVKPEYLEAFREKFEEGVRLFAEPGTFEEKIEVDGEVPTQFISLETVKLLEGEVWGQKFPPPMFVGQFEVKSTKILKDKHTKFVLKKNGSEFEAIKFNWADPVGKSVNLVYRMAKNDWSGNVQLMIDEVLPA